jgi:hypothetical protein
LDKPSVSSFAAFGLQRYKKKSNKLHLGKILTLFLCRILFKLYGKRYIKDGNSPRKQLNSIKMMNRKGILTTL